MAPDATVMTVDELREELSNFSGYLPVAIRLQDNALFHAGEVTMETAAGRTVVVVDLEDEVQGWLG